MSPQRVMIVEVERQDGLCVVRLKGSLPATADPEFFHSKSEEIKSRNCGLMLVDLSGLNSIGSTGIGFLVGIYTTMLKAEGRFVMVGPQPRVRDVLNLTRLSSILPMAADFAAGVAALRDPGPAMRAAKK